MQDIVQELRSIQTLLDLLMQKRLQLPSRTPSWSAPAISFSR